MDNPKKEVEVSEEELQQEQDALKESPEDELRAKIVDELGLDPETQSELVDNIVKKRIEAKKQLSKAIKQKIAFRDKLKPHKEEKSEEKPQKPEEGKDDKKDKSLSESDVDSIVSKRLAKQELETLDFSDELKQEIKNEAERKKISIKKAVESEYIKFLIEKEKDKERVDDASITGQHKSAPARRDLAKMTITEAKEKFDLNTEEGRTAYAKWKKTTRNKIK